MLKQVGDWVKIKPQNVPRGLDSEGRITRRDGGYVWINLKCVDLDDPDCFGMEFPCVFYDCEFE